MFLPKGVVLRPITALAGSGTTGRLGLHRIHSDRYGFVSSPAPGATIHHESGGIIRNHSAIPAAVKKAAHSLLLILLAVYTAPAPCSGFTDQAEIMRAMVGAASLMARMFNRWRDSEFLWREDAFEHEPPPPPWAMQPWPGPHRGHDLQGVWLSPGGEMLAMLGSRFELRSAGGETIAGQMRARGNRLWFRTAGTTLHFLMRQRGDELLLIDPNNHLLAFRRLMRQPGGIPSAPPW
jgi:hypothetical protein